MVSPYGCIAGVQSPGCKTQRTAQLLFLHIACSQLVSPQESPAPFPVSPVSLLTWISTCSITKIIRCSGETCHRSLVKDVQKISVSLNTDFSEHKTLNARHSSAATHPNKRQGHIAIVLNASTPLATETRCFSGPYPPILSIKISAQ